MAEGQLCDFVWEHYYGSRWITYNDDQQILLNKALHKGQKTVTLKNDIKGQIIVDLDRMYQLNKKSSIRQNVRCLVWNETDFISWICINDDQWNSYKPVLVLYLELAYSQNEKNFKFYDGVDYLVNLETFYEINEKTTKMRPVKREIVVLNKETYSSHVFGIMMNSMGLKQIVSKVSLNFQNRLMDLPSLSSTVANMSRKSQEFVVPPLSPRASRNEDEIIYKEALPVDPEFINYTTYRIYREDDVIFSATLMLVNVQTNANKFYLVQLAVSENPTKYAVLTKYGRVGSKSQIEIFAGDLKATKKDFETKFHLKTGNTWEEQKTFVKKDGKYDLLHVDLNPEVTKSEMEVDLHPAIKSLLEMICNQATFRKILGDMNYNSDNAPIGHLTLHQIKKGYVSLNDIAQAISRENSGEEIVKSCNEFYTKIPHNFGKKRLPLIQTEDDIMEKLQLLEALSNIRITTTALEARTETVAHPLNRLYDAFSIELVPLDVGEEKFSALKKCLKSTNGPTHKEYEIKLLEAFECHAKRKTKPCSIGNSHLLWHGTRLTNLASILKKGLRIAPREAPSTGTMFGKGLYFADVCSKSAGYCFPTQKENKGILLLCEVCLGEQKILTQSNKYLPDAMASHFNSVFGKGKYQPRFQGDCLSEESKTPCGPVQLQFSDSILNYNEYVVYDNRQVKIKYLLKVSFTFQRRT